MDSGELVNLLKRLDQQPRSYSGRGMYERQCVGIVVDSDDDLWNLAQQLGAESVVIESPRIDQMGRGIIAYWPRFEWPDHAIDADVEEEDERG
jgi:hypothetical protein